MKFFAALFALMAVSSVVAVPFPKDKGLDILSKGGKGLAAAKASKGSKGSQNDGSAAAAAAAAASANSTSIDNASADNSTASADNSTASAVDNSTASTATASSSTTVAKNRLCDQGDQSLAAGLQALVVVGLGQQASVLTLQNATAAADFTDGVTRLQQFTDTAGLQLQMAQGIADNGSLAQTQLALLATSQTAQEASIKTLVDAKTSAADLTTLLASFVTSTNNAQDGAGQALADCALPTTAISG